MIAGAIMAKSMELSEDNAKSSRESLRDYSWKTTLEIEARANWNTVPASAP